MKKKYRRFIRRKRKNRSKLRAVMITGLFIIGIILFLMKGFSFTGTSIETKEKIQLDDIQRFPISGENIQNIKNFSDKKKRDYISDLVLIMLENSLFTEDKQLSLDEIKGYYTKGNTGPGERDYYKKIYQYYKEVLKDVIYFPIPQQRLETRQEATNADFPYRYEIEYVDSWGSERNYKVTSRHEGTDIMDQYNMRGRIPIVSMTDGKIERLGWNELGGWRVGIRAPSGAYFYYAHLAKYKEGLEEGVAVKAGDLIGYMGDSGNSPKEGTFGNFAVHLHLGIALSETNEENGLIWINPYPVLKYIEPNQSVIENLD